MPFAFERLEVYQKALAPVDESCFVKEPSAGDAGRTTPRRTRWGMGGRTVARHGTPAAEDVGLARGRTRCQELFDRAWERN